MRYCSYKVVPLFSKSERENDGKEEGVDSVTIKKGGKQGTETEGRKEPNKQKKWGEFEFVYFFFFLDCFRFKIGQVRKGGYQYQ